MNPAGLDLLVLDGNGGDLSLFRAQVEDAAPGHVRVTATERLEDAVRHLGERRFDAVLADLQLPGGAGLETVREVRRRANGAALLVLSGSADDPVATQALRHGAQDIVVKGQSSADSVLRTVRHAIERKSEERRLHDALSGLERKAAERAAELERYNARLQGEIAEHRKAEERLRQLGDLYAILCEVSESIARATSETDLLCRACDLIAAHEGYIAAGYGVVDFEQGRIVPGFVSSGFEEVAAGLSISLDPEDPHGRGAAPTAAREDRDVFVDDFLAASAGTPWEFLARQFRVRSVAALPIRRDGRVAAVFSIFSREPGFFGEEERKLARRLADNIAHALDSLQRAADRDRARAEIERNAARVERAMLATVRAVSSIVEQRDPYIAGHQRRVGDLMAAIGAAMGLDAERCRGLRVIGEVHDVGTIGVPAQILSKPAALAPVEMQLVRVHAMAGYEVLRGIDFPWPVAEAVRQHHERLDGSGYPRGLKGDEILLEARILAVADVVEAMVSHRPYRPSLGIETALGEIEAHAGTRYCPEAAAACLRLFRESGYRLPD